MEAYLIDPTGETWDAQSGRLRMRYGANLTSTELQDFLIRNTGFVLMSRSTSSASIKAAPGLVSYACFSTVSELITRWSPPRVGLTWFASSWRYEMLPGWVPARERLMSLMLEAEEAQHQTFRIEPRNPAQLPADGALSNTLSLWRERDGVVDLREDRNALEEAAGGKFTIVRRDAERKAIEFVCFGAGIDLYLNRNWKSSLTGCRVDEQPDLAFGRWLAESYVEGMVAGSPTLWDIDATANDIAARRGVRKVYTRLVMPIETNQPGEHLLCASTIYKTSIVPIMRS